MPGNDEIRILSPTGVCGSGFLEASFDKALAWDPHFIGCDAGSTDPGPSHLGTGEAAFPREAVKRDLRLMLLGARRKNIPLLIGSAGTAGGDAHVEWFCDIVKEIAREESLSFRLAVIHAEQDKAYLKKRLREGRVKPLQPAPSFDEDVIERSACIVGMMGIEPYQRALEQGAQVIVAGRASDTAIFAALPIMHGVPEGIAWHAAKILECGAAAVVNRRTPDCMFAWLRKDHFIVQAPDETLRCTPQSIASHSLYENADPFRLVECSGTLDLTESRYEPHTDLAVKVSGSRFLPAERYTVKLEGAEKAGYQSVVIGSVRDPFIIRQIDDWTERLVERIHARVNMVYGERLKRSDYVVNIRIYGKNGTMGPLEPVKEIRSHELCLLIEVTGPSQDIASSIAGIVRHQGLHLPIPEWSGLITALACPYNPAHLDRGAVYRFNVNHVVEPDDPHEMFRTRQSKAITSRRSRRERSRRETEGKTRGGADLTKLAELARLIRSKNAGPFELTFDIMFEDEARYRRVQRSGALTREAVAKLYGLPVDQVKFFYVDNALAVKASIPRPATQGDLDDADGHGGQQYAPLMDIEIS